MNTYFYFLTTKGLSSRWQFWLIGGALIVGLIFSILSWLELCVEHCTVNQDYRLFGLPFAIMGIAFFSLLVALHFLSWRYQFLSQYVEWMVASALGAEVMFLIIQKYQIGHWCPVCLTIATSVAFAALVIFTRYLRDFKITLRHRGNIMKLVKKSLTSFSFVLLGILMAFVGVSKTNEAEAAVNDIKERIVFGTKKSPVEIYFITDWFCPSCKKVEPLIEKIYPKIKSQVTFYFIDYPIHRKSLNFTPYNLAFLVHDKEHYFRARDALNDLSDSNEAPTDEDVSKISKKNDLNYKELSFLEIRSGIDFFDMIGEKYKIKATPTIIIVNTKNDKKFVKLEGRDEISESAILKGIEKVKS